jgi:Ni2+-binding GTPase involved in maturation of urease and hydrogenase
VKPRLPLTVIGGYLGAGKTTLVNRLLTGNHGRRIMVMVNDFGAVNIDASLLASASEDTLELTNGCVCCTMGVDLFMAVGDVLDRAERPDHLVIEASGIADPAAIAEVSRTEPELSYAGIVTVVDALNFEDLMQDVQIAPQLGAQVGVADLVYVSKARCSSALMGGLTTLGAQRVLDDVEDLLPLLWEIDGKAPNRDGTHAHFVKWDHQSEAVFSHEELIAKLKTRPAGLYRFKGFAKGGWEVQVVGKSVEVTQRDGVETTAFVGIGPEGQLTQDEMEAWWQE